MKHDDDTLPEAFAAFTHTKAGAYEPPDAVQVAIIAEILETNDKPAAQCVEDAVKLIAKSMEVLKQIRSDAAQPDVDFGATVSIQEAAEETGLTVRTIQSYASQKHESGKPLIKIENGRISRLYLTSIKKLNAENKTARAKKGFIASKKFKGKKRKANK
jgi:hypothetical protein